MNNNEPIRVSYDCWGTILKSNPKFKEEQLKIASEMSGIDIETIQTSYKNVKGWVDKRVEKFGLQYSREFLYTMIFKESKIDIKQYIDISNQLFLKYPPFKINELLKADYVIPYITSNTVLIYGDVLGKVIQNYFDIPLGHMQFSDEVGVSKPNRKIFDAHNVELDYHIGDNLVTDGVSESYNITFVHINEYNQVFSKFF